MPKISGYPDGGAIQAADKFVIVRSGSNRSILGSSMFSILNNRNAIINGSFRVAQRGTTFTSATTPANSDDTYLLDRWILLSDGNDIVDVSQETSATIADPSHNIKLDVETANKKFGILQILEQKDSRKLINQTVSLSFKAKITGTTIGAIRAAVLAWSSTADSPTSDVVSAWEAALTNPTLVANWTYENTPAALTAPTTSWQTYEIEGISIDTAAATNIAVFIWADDTAMSVGDFLHIADVQLELGANSTPFEFRHYAAELALCQRYCTVTPDGANAYGEAAPWSMANSTSQVTVIFQLAVPLRTSPTLTTIGNFRLDDGVSAHNVTTITIAAGSTGILSLYVNVAATPLTQFRPYKLSANNDTTARLIFNAEL